MIRTIVIALLCAAAAHGASLVENAQAVKTASDAIDAAIASKGGTTAGGLANAAAAIAALPSGGKWEVKPWRNDGKTHIWFRYEDGAPRRLAYLYAQFISASAFTVDWGDGSTSTVAASASFTNRELSHTYAEDGDYEMTVYGYDKIKLSATGWLYNNGGVYQRARFACRQLEIANVDTITGACYCNLAAAVKIHTVSGQAISLPGSCFASSINTQTISVPLLSIGSSAFQSCSSLQSLGDLSACTSIGSSAFQDCSSLQSLGDLSACTSIGVSAFFNCTSLHGDLVFTRLVTLASSNASADGVFRNTKIARLVCPNLTTAGNHSINYMPELVFISELENLTMINDAFLAGCSKLPYFSAPNVTSVSSWGMHFYGCRKLATAKLGLLDFTSWKINDWLGYTGVDVPEPNKYGVKVAIWMKNPTSSAPKPDSSVTNAQGFVLICRDGYLRRPIGTWTWDAAHPWESVAELPDEGDHHYVFTINGVDYRWNDLTRQYEITTEE